MEFSHRQYLQVGEKIPTASALLKGEEPRRWGDTESLFSFSLCGWKQVPNSTGNQIQSDWTAPGHSHMLSKQDRESAA